MDLVTLDRIQFAFTVMFHYLFPIATMGLAPFIAWFTWRAHFAEDKVAAGAARFWTRIFAVNFAIGVVTGIPMEFQFGTNWAVFSAQAGGVIGQPLAMEGVYAFFLESIFLGVLLYGRDKVSKRLHAASAVLVWWGSWLSGYFIVATDAWMQHPVGYTVAKGGRIELASLSALLFSPFALWQDAHVMCGAVVAGGFIVAGVGAYYLLVKRDEEYGRAFVQAGIPVAFAFSLLVVFPTGDRNGSDVTIYQPVKLAAMEGLFEETHGAPLAIIGMPDPPSRTLIDPVVVPDILSFLAYGNFNAEVKGLGAYPREVWPPVELTYYAYHIMVGLGTMFAAVATCAVLLLWRGMLFRQRWMLWAIMLAMPFPYIANEAGWTVTEVGRQPWLVYGLMRTSAGVSPNVVGGETLFTLLGFAGLYLLLGLMFVYVALREIRPGSGMNEFAFWLLAFMVAMYVLLDGYDLGVGAVTPLVARSSEERSTAMHSIGPFWNGNEVWLIAAGGALFALFPAAYAASFSAFYLPFMVVLWLLVGRGMAMELRNHYDNAVWQSFWDAVFSLSSGLLILLFGVAIGNLVRGLPLTSSLYFEGSFAFLLNPYAVSAGILAVLSLMLHGAVFLGMRTDGELRARSYAFARTLWIAVVIAYVLVTVWSVLTLDRGSLGILAIPVVSLAALCGVRITIAGGSGRGAFACTSAYLATLLIAAAATMFPYVLPGFPRAETGMSIYAASPSPAALAVALSVTGIGLVAVVIYGAFVTRRLA